MRAFVLHAFAHFLDLQCLAHRRQAFCLCANAPSINGDPSERAFAVLPPFGIQARRLLSSLPISRRWTRRRSSSKKTLKETPMGKYFLAWLLGVPAGLLIIIYVIMHL